MQGNEDKNYKKETMAEINSENREEMCISRFRVQKRNAKKGRSQKINNELNELSPELKARYGIN